MWLWTFTAAPVDASTVLAARSAPASEAIPLLGITPIHLDVVPSASVPLSAKARDANAIYKAIASLISDVRYSHHSSSYVENALSLARSDHDKHLAVGHCPPTSNVGSHAAIAPPVAAGAVLSEAKLTCGTRSTLLPYRLSEAEPSI